MKTTHTIRASHPDITRDFYPLDWTSEFIKRFKHDPHGAKKHVDIYSQAHPGFDSARARRMCGID